MTDCSRHVVVVLRSALLPFSCATVRTGFNRTYVQQKQQRYSGTDHSKSRLRHVKVEKPTHYPQCFLERVLVMVHRLLHRLSWNVDDDLGVVGVGGTTITLFDAFSQATVSATNRIFSRKYLHVSLLFFFAGKGRGRGGRGERGGGLRLWTPGGCCMFWLSHSSFLVLFSVLIGCRSKPDHCAELAG